MELIGQTFQSEQMETFSVGTVLIKELERLYAKRDMAFQKVQAAKEALGKAENDWYAAKAEIAEHHRKNGAKG